MRWPLLQKLALIFPRRRQKEALRYRCAACVEQELVLAQQLKIELRPQLATHKHFCSAVLRCEIKEIKSTSSLW
jgi:hypothetical protein